MKKKLEKAIGNLVNSIHAADPTCQDVLIKDLYSQALRIKEHIPAAMKLYATEKVKEALREAMSTARLYTSDADGYILAHFIWELKNELIEKINKEI